MSFSLEAQTVYSEERNYFSEIILFVVFAALILAVYTFYLKIKVENTDLAYEIAAVKKHNTYLISQKKELELQKTFLMRPDYIQKKALALGYRPVQSTDLHVITK